MTARTAPSRRRRPAVNALAQALNRSPWAITHAGKQRLLHAALAKLPDPAVLEAEPGQPLDQSTSVTVRDGIATLRVVGPLFRYSSWWSDYFGWASYESIARDIILCRENPNVRATIVDFDSPGGEVNGVSECARILFGGRDEKPQTAFASGDCCSGAYWLAAAVGKIVAGDTAILGSIGVISYFYDDREFLKQMGFEEIVLRSTQSPRKALTPVDPEGRAEWQRLLDELAAVFVDGTAEYRGVDPATVLAKYGQGAVFVGAGARDAGLADDMNTFENLLEELSTATTPGLVIPPGASASASRVRPTPSTTENNVPKPKSTAGGGATTARADADNPEEEPGQEDPDETDPGEADDDENEPESSDPATQERARVKGIMALRRSPSEDTIINSCIDDPKCSVADAALKLRQAEPATRSSRVSGLKKDEDEVPAPGAAAARSGAQDVTIESLSDAIATAGKPTTTRASVARAH